MGRPVTIGQPFDLWGLPAALEHLLRYCARPPFALERLSLIRVSKERIAKVCYVLSAVGVGSQTVNLTATILDPAVASVGSGTAATTSLTLTANVIVVPEPAAVALAGIGIAAAVLARRRRK